MTTKKRDVRDVLKWGALAAAAMNPIVNHYHASYYLLTHSTPYPYPPEPFLFEIRRCRFAVDTYSGFGIFAEVGTELLH